MIGPVLQGKPAPALASAAALVAGTLAGSRSVTSAFPAVLLAAAAVALGALSRRGPGVFSPAARLVFFAAAGFLSGFLRIAEPARTAERAANLLEPRSSADRVEGVLADFWSGDPPRARSRLRAERLLVGGRWREFPAEVFVFVGGEESLRSRGDRGDRLRIVGRLRPEELAASDRDIPLPWRRYRMSVKSALRIERRGTTLMARAQWPNRWLVGAIPRGDAAFERDVRGPLAALLLGRTSELDRGMVADYRRGGLYHLLVISGLHVALAAGLVWWVLRLLRVRGKTRDALLLTAVVGIVVVTGANPPAVRAGIVFAVFLTARLLERPIAGAQAFGLSAILLFAAAPAELYSIGTVLTFAAVSGIALFSEPIRARLPSRPDWLFAGLATSLAAQAATAPILLWRFNLVAAGSWLTTPAAIPLSTALIALGAVLLVLMAAGAPVGLLAAAFAFGVRLLAWVAERAAGLAYLRPTPPLPAVFLVLALLLAAARLPGGSARRAAAALAGGLFLWLALRRGPSGPPDGFSIEALDVGQGDAILLRWARHAVLVDGGGPFDRDARDFGRTHLLPKLLDRGVTRLDAVLLTHPHPDHALGLFSILRELPVGRFWRSAGDDEGGFFRDLDSEARQRGIPVSRVAPRQRWRTGGALLTILHSGGARRKVDPVNNQSVVAVFENDGRRALLTGDAGAATEKDLVRVGAIAPIDVLKVGHHGSRGSTTPALLAASRPRAALLSCGRENRFGHPAPATLALFARFHLPLFRTDLCSDVRIELPARGGTRLRRRGP